MNVVKIIGRGTFYRTLARACGTPMVHRYRNRPYDILVNWGLTGSRFDNFPVRRNAMVVNRPPNQTKFTQLTKVSKVGVPILESVQHKDQLGSTLEWLFKPMFSLGGRNICMAGEESGHVPGYYQRFIPGEKRRYELRVHACRWQDEENYLVQKRVCDNKSMITWNHHTGGRFICVNHTRNHRVFKEAAAYSTKVLDAVGLDFGGVDFIVDVEKRIYFLEINMSLGLRLAQTLGYWRDCMLKLVTKGVVL